jgi:hypothetical protein
MNRAHSVFRVADARAGMTGKTSPGHSNGPTSMTRRRLFSCQSKRPTQASEAHRRAEMSVTGHGRRQPEPPAGTWVSRVSELSFLSFNRPRRPSAATPLSSARHQPNGVCAAMQRACQTVMSAGLLPEQPSLAQATPRGGRTRQIGHQGWTACIQDSSPQVSSSLGVQIGHVVLVSSFPQVRRSCVTGRAVRQVWRTIRAQPVSGWRRP